MAKELTIHRRLSNREEPGAPDVRAFDVSDYERIMFQKAVREKFLREIEATSLYEPLPNQLAFHKSNARERILRGSNRSGKTLAAALELALIVANRHPYLKYPKGGRVIAVGRSEEHIGNVMWDKLAKIQPKFRRIRDEATGKWRTYKPWLPEDRAREEESVPMTPLIPERLLAREPSWYSKKDNVPRNVHLKTGWEIKFFPGGGKPPCGMDVDYVWFDEEVENSEWYLEMAARLLDRNGRFVWSATAQTGGDQLWNLHLRAEEEEGSPEPAVTEHPMILANNPHIDEKEKQELALKYKHDPDSYRVRVLGEYLITSFRMYPTFSKTNHCCTPFEIPPDWCRYMIVDPGSVICAVLFLAVPPDESHIYVYDELYLRNCDPEMFGDAVQHKVKGHIFQSFIIDDNGSRRTEASSGTTVRQVYAEQLKRRRLRSRASGSGFELGLSNVKSGVEKVKQWMHPKQNSSDGLPYLQVHHDGQIGCTNFVYEIERYHRKRVKGHLVDEPEQKHNHLMDDLRYAAMHGCRYIKPKKIKPTSNGRRMFDKKQKRNKKKPEGILLGAKGN